MVAYLQYILLVYHHPVSLFQLFLHHRVEVVDTSPDDETAGYTSRIMPLFDTPGRIMELAATSVMIVVAPQLHKQSAHGRTFNIKTADGFTRPELFAHLRIGFEILYAVNIDLLPRGSAV
jgi:hypothetical protein